MIKNLEVNLSPLNRYIALDLSLHSKKYRKDGKIYKIPRVFDDNLKKVLKSLNNKRIKNVVEIKEIFSKNDKEYAYSMRNYKNYKSLRRVKNRDIQLKIEDCKKIIKAFYELGRRNMKYCDFYMGNVLIQEETNDIVVCDVDSIEIEKDKFEINKSVYNSVCLCASYLYNTDYTSMRAYIKSKGKLDNKDIIYSCLDSVGKEDFFKKVNKLSELDYNNILINRRRIKYLAKEEYNAHPDYYRKL